MLADPIATNSNFSHFGNVLDPCAMSVPAGTYPVSELQVEPVPFGVTCLGGSGMDGETLEIARRFEVYIG